MKWVLSHQSREYRRWILRNAEDEAEFTYHVYNHSVRIKAKTLRLFFLQQIGFLQKKILLRSEYGVVVAEAQAANRGRIGTLLFDNRKLAYRFDGKELLIFDKERKVIAEQRIECRDDTGKLEEMAFVFMAAWMAVSAADARKAEALLVV